MSEFQPTFEESLQYYENRLQQKLPKTDQVVVHCVFHRDSHPSFSLSLRKGVWHCHSCGAHGGMIDLEKKLFNKPTEESWAAIYALINREQPRRDRYVEKVYSYPDESRTLLYQKLRWFPKDFTQRQPDGHGGWLPHIRGVRRVLYNLPRLITARLAIVCEGEKDADNLLAALDAAGVKDCCATTCFGGARSWQASYGPYFAGKLVIVLRDNDAPGLLFQQTVCESVKPFAYKLKAVDLSGLAEHGDISDWLDAGGTIPELMELIKQAPLWTPADVDHELLCEAYAFMTQDRPEIEWLVEGLIPIQTRGLLVGSPKDGKSILALDLAMALATGSPWLGHQVPSRRRVAIISREDAPRETARRLHALAKGSAPRGVEILAGAMWVNTMDQCVTMHLDNQEQQDALIKELQAEMFDMVIFDVFRDLHVQDENDNTVMAGVLAVLKRIQVECSCAVLVLHHVRKDHDANVFRSSRGASAIHGWTEYGIGISVVDETLPRKDWIRRVDFELKCAMAADPVYFRISSEENKTLRVELTEAPVKPPQQPREMTGADRSRAFDKSRAYKEDA